MHAHSHTQEIASADNRAVRWVCFQNASLHPIRFDAPNDVIICEHNRENDGLVMMMKIAMYTAQPLVAFNFIHTYLASKCKVR